MSVGVDVAANDKEGILAGLASILEEMTADWELDYEVCHLVASARRRKIPVTHITRHPEGRFLPVEALH